VLHHLPSIEESRMRASTLALSLSCAAALWGTADGPLLAQEVGGAPPVQHQNGIAYVSGGVGRDEAVAMRGMAPRFNVRMHFLDSAGGGALSDVSVTVFDARRQIILLVLSEGPFLYMKLAPGSYRTVIRYGTALECRRIHVLAGGHRVHLLVRFPGQLEEGELLAGPLEAGAVCGHAPACCGGTHS